MDFLRVTMTDGSMWDIPVEVIAKNRAAYYKDEFGDDLEKSLREDTLPLFEKDKYEIVDWAANNMNWEDVVGHAILVPRIPMPLEDYQEGWINGNKKVVSRESPKDFGMETIVYEN